MSSYNGSSIDADMDNFLDYTGGNLQSPRSAMDPMSAVMSNEHADERQVLSGPSHEYDRFKQQTGLPSGAMSSMGVFGGDTTGEGDFGSVGAYAQNTGYGSLDADYGPGMAFDMDYAAAPAVPTFFFPGSAATDMNEFVEPSGIPHHYHQANPPRLWPGMHSQQANQARAEASARQQQQQMQGQQIMERRNREYSVSSHMSVGSRKSRAPSQAGMDPIADERISRILDTMRHNGTVSPVEEESNPLEDGSSRSAKMRKEEEEMDEDERLLASEEGKKLSSKERRQLRNKVSARAFRSRRKEYISQLEGEVASKANECTDLKNQNRKLADENNQLKHLTRTLLSHPAFQTFLDDMSRDPSVITPFRDSLQSAQEVINSEESTPQQSESMDQEPTPIAAETQVNMASMPNNTLGFSMLNLGNNHWASTNTNFAYQQPQVFSVVEVPEGPSFEEVAIPRIPSLKELERTKFNSAPKLPASSTAIAPLPTTQQFSDTNPPFEPMQSLTHHESDMNGFSQEIDNLFETADSSMERIVRLTSHLKR